MKHVMECFQAHKGTRGVTFYDEKNCNFLTWDEVFQLLKDFPSGGMSGEFCDKLTTTMANYNPDTEFLAVHQSKETSSVELFSRAD